MTQVTWTFQRSGAPNPDGEHLVRAEFRTLDPDSSTETVMVFVLTEAAALGMRNDLTTVATGLTVASTIKGTG